MAIHLSPHQLLNRLCLPLWFDMPPILFTKFPCVSGSISRVFILFHWTSVHSCSSTTVLIKKLYSMFWSLMEYLPLDFFFLFSDFLALSACLVFHMNFTINLFMPIKKFAVIFLGIVLHYWINIGRTNILMKSSHLNREQGMSTHLFKSNIALFRSILKISL